MNLINKKTLAFQIVVTVFLLIMFLPIFFYIIFYGSNLNYNELHKIVTIEGNKVLLLCVSVASLALLVLYCFLRRIPYNRFTKLGVVLLTLIMCIIFYAINVHISKCIAFYGGWDCGMVANSARNVYRGNDLGYDDYYTIYSNNIPITWLLYKLYCISSGCSGYPYNPEFIWIQFQCLMLTMAVFFTVMTVLMICKKIGLAILTLLINSIFLGLSPWKVIPYTDASTIAFPVCVIFLYAVFLKLKSKWKYLIWLLLIFVGILGGIMKATCYVTFIAIIIIDLVWTVFDKKPICSKAKILLFKIMLLVCGYVLAMYCKHGMYQTLNYEYDYDMEIGWSNYLFNGLNEETTGACSGEGLEIVRNYAGNSKNERIAYELECIKDRIADKGFMGLLNFWLRKQVMNYNDGTFSWYQEGFFNASPYEDIVDSSWKQPLREFYWQEGKDYLSFTTLSQGIWIFVLLGVIFEAIMVLFHSITWLKAQNNCMEQHVEEMQIRTICILIFIGIFLFVMLFEARARYLYNTIPVFSTMAIIGYCDFADVFCQKRNTSAK